MAIYQLKRDGELKHEGTENECFIKLQRLQSQSADWAMKYEGWTVTEKEYNTLEELQALAYNQVNAQQIINGRIDTKLNGWESVKVSAELRKAVAERIAEILGGRETTKGRISSAIRRGKPQHWGLERITIENYEGKYFLEYTAGQDAQSERATIRTQLKNK